MAVSCGAVLKTVKYNLNPFLSRITNVSSAYWGSHHGMEIMIFMRVGVLTFKHRVNYKIFKFAFRKVNTENPCVKPFQYFLNTRSVFIASCWSIGRNMQCINFHFSDPASRRHIRNYVRREPAEAKKRTLGSSGGTEMAFCSSVGKVPLPRTSLIEIIDIMALIFVNCFLMPHSSLGPLPRKIYCQHLFTKEHGLPPLNTSLYHNLFW